MFDRVSAADYAILAGVIAQARKDAKLSQRALGVELGIGQKIISAIEIGDRRVDLLELMAFERVLGLRPLELARRTSAALAAKRR